MEKTKFPENREDIECWTGNLLGAISDMRKAKSAEDLFEAFNEAEYAFGKLTQLVDSIEGEE